MIFTLPWHFLVSGVCTALYGIANPYADFESGFGIQEFQPALARAQAIPWQINTGDDVRYARNPDSSAEDKSGLVTTLPHQF
jgi:hypothetical protein